VREKELIALAIGLATRCVPCINLHVQKCLNAGATPEQVSRRRCGRYVAGGTVFTHVPEVIRALEYCQPRSETTSYRGAFGGRRSASWRLKRMLDW
jgi:AhpD family alkylhydroperoxidase